MKAIWVVSVITSILILGTLGSTQTADAIDVDLAFTGPMTIVKQGTSDPSPFVVGESVNISANIINQGSETAFGFLSRIVVLDPNGNNAGLDAGPLNTLAPGESTAIVRTFKVQPSFIPGTYTVTMTVDSGDVIPETDESNNVLIDSFEIVLPNNAPDCSGAFPNIDSIWPRNHKMVSITVNGVTDSDGDVLSISINRITQDEPTSGVGMGHKSPDGAGVGTNTAQVRAESLSSADGRVYVISFSADDGNGGTCSGTVSVGVPTTKKGIAIDSGQNFDSTI